MHETDCPANCRMLVTILLGVLATATAFPPMTPERMTYQGYLTDSNGVPLGNWPQLTMMSFFVSTMEPEVQTVTWGYFSALLGDLWCIQKLVFVGGDRFIGSLHPTFVASQKRTSAKCNNNASMMDRLMQLPNLSGACLQQEGDEQNKVWRRMIRLTSIYIDGVVAQEVEPLS